MRWFARRLGCQPRGWQLALFVAAVVAAFGHLLGPHVNGPAVGDPGGHTPSALAAAAVGELPEDLPQHSTSEGVRTGCSVDKHPAGGGDGHESGETCGYLNTAVDSNQLSPPAAWAGNVLAVPASLTATVAVRSWVGRDSPDLVRELQVIRV